MQPILSMKKDILYSMSTDINTGSFGIVTVRESESERERRRGRSKSTTATAKWVLDRQLCNVQCIELRCRVKETATENDKKKHTRHAVAVEGTMERKEIDSFLIQCSALWNRCRNVGWHLNGRRSLIKIDVDSVWLFLPFRFARVSSVRSLDIFFMFIDFLSAFSFFSFDRINVISWDVWVNGKSRCRSFGCFHWSRSWWDGKARARERANANESIKVMFDINLKWREWWSRLWRSPLSRKRKSIIFTNANGTTSCAHSCTIPLKASH